MVSIVRIIEVISQVIFLVIIEKILVITTIIVIVEIALIIITLNLITHLTSWSSSGQWHGSTKKKDKKKKTNIKDWKYLLQHIQPFLSPLSAVCPTFVKEDHDNRPYLTVNIAGQEIVALVDIGRYSTK